MSEVAIEDRFAANLDVLSQAILTYITEVRKQGVNIIQPELVQAATLFIRGYNHVSLIEGFIGNTHDSCWEHIRTRNEVHFVQNSEAIFKQVPVAQVNLLKQLFEAKDANGQSVITPVMKQQIWTLLDNLVKGSIKYVHHARGPKIVKQNGMDVKTYSNAEKFSFVNLPYHIEKWGMAKTLSWPTI